MSNTVTVTGSRRELTEALEAAVIADGRVLKSYDAETEFGKYIGGLIRLEDPDQRGYEVGTITTGIGFSDCIMTLNTGRIPANAVGRVVAAAVGGR